VKLTLPYPPSLNRLYRMVNGRFLTSEVGRDYKKAILRSIHGVKKIEVPIRITVEAYRPAKRGDLDNTLKALVDSMQGICYENDSQIVEIHAYRKDDKVNPRVEIEIVPV
jgi:crossover junction endodeoxyribonuclease RusA